MLLGHTRRWHFQSSPPSDWARRFVIVSSRRDIGRVQDVFFAGMPQITMAEGSVGSHGGNGKVVAICAHLSTSPFIQHADPGCSKWPFLRAFQIYPTYHHLRSTQLAQMREKWHQPPKTHRVGMGFQNLRSVRGIVGARRPSAADVRLCHAVLPHSPLDWWHGTISDG